MSVPESEERIAVLLSALGDDVSQQVIGSLPQDTATRVQSYLQQFADDPLDEEEVEDVLDEFLRFFRFAMQHRDEVPTDSGEGTLDEHVDEATLEAQPEPEPKKEFQPTGDVFFDLRQLEPFQIAGALMDENPRTVAVILNCLPTEVAGAALQFLPEEVRGSTLLTMRDPPRMPPALLAQMVKAAVRKGCHLGADDVMDPSAEANRKMAELLRAMDQDQRTAMIKILEEQEPDMIAEVKKLMYSFDDLLKIANRSIQKILGEVESGSLAAALKGADEALVERVMGNLSKRARATLVEEIEFLGHVKPAEQQMAREAICDVIAKLDESGDLEMME